MAPPGTPTPSNPVRSAQALRTLHLRVVRRLDGLLHGEHTGLGLGQGSESAEAREYQPGQDDVRRMDWALTARTTTAHVRDLVADRELESWTLLDATASMNFGTTTTAKHDIALGALVALNALTQRGGDRLGIHVLHPTGLTRHAPHSGPHATLTLLHHATRPPVTTQPASATTLANAATDLTHRRRRRGMRIIISDFLDTPPATSTTTGPAWEPALRHLAQRHQVLAVEILDPRELDLPALGWITLRAPETGRVRDIHISQRTRRDYQQAAQAQRQATQAALRRSGATHLVLRTDRDWIRDIARFAAHHRRVAHRTVRPTTRH